LSPSKDFLLRKHFNDMSQGNLTPHTAQLNSIVNLIDHHSTLGVLPSSTGQAAVRMLIDTLSCVFEGRNAPEVKSLELSLGHEHAGIFRFPGGPRLSSWSCATVAAMASTWSEACEGLPYAHGRPGLSIVGALLPLAVERNATLGEVLRALSLGYEVGARCGGWLRIRPGMHVDGNWPGLGVAVAVSHLLKLSTAQTITALNIAACQLPASLYLPIKTGHNARNTYLSHSALLGLMSAYSAQAGITAPREALLEYAQHHAVNDGLPVPGESHAFIEDAYFKPFASARHVHYGVEAALKVRLAMVALSGASDSVSNSASNCAASAAEIDVWMDAIESIVLKVYPEAATYAGNRDPQATITGQFSLSLGVASALRFGHMDPKIYDPALFFDPALRRLERMVDIEVDPEIARTGQRQAVLCVKTKNATFQEKIEHLMGDPMLPMSEAEVLDKFTKYSSGSVTNGGAARFIQALMHGSAELNFADAWRMLY
jgi:2-methylcitrate dehydratase PrpD